MAHMDIVFTVSNIDCNYFFLGSREKRQLTSDNDLGFFERPSLFDDTLFFDLPHKDYYFSRSARGLFSRPRPQKPQPSRDVPQYPPFDPFGNTEYIETGPSNPHNALPLTGGNPHASFNFRRPFFKK